MSLKFDNSFRSIAAAVFSLLMLSEVALAAPSLGYPKGRPYYGSSNQRASRSIRHSRSYARNIYRYSRDADEVDPTVAKSESEELAHNISKAQKELAEAKQDAGNDPQTLAALKSVEQHLANAAKHHAMLHEECCKDSVDGGACMKHCNQILLELDKAQAEQDALIRTMEMNVPKGASSSTTTPQH